MERSDNQVLVSQQLLIDPFPFKLFVCCRMFSLIPFVVIILVVRLFPVSYLLMHVNFFVGSLVDIEWAKAVNRVTEKVS